MQTLTDIFEEQSPVTRRLQTIGLITEMYDIVEKLEDINNAMDSEISIEDAHLDFDTIIVEHTFRFKPILDPKSYHDETRGEAIINHLTDFFPLDNKYYSFTLTKADKLKTGLRHLNSSAIMDGRDINFALNKGVEQIFSLTRTIQNKKKTILNYQYENYWYDIMGGMTTSYPRGS